MVTHNDGHRIWSNSLCSECTLTTLLIKTLHHTDIHVSLCALTFTCTFSSFRLCETVVPLEDPIITETTSTLQEWGVLWKQLYVVSSTISQHISLILNKKKQQQLSNKCETGSNQDFQGSWGKKTSFAKKKLHPFLFLCILLRGFDGIGFSSMFFFPAPNTTPGITRSASESGE